MSYRMQYHGLVSDLSVAVLADKVDAAKKTARPEEFTLIESAADYIHTLLATIDPRAMVEVNVSGHLAPTGTAIHTAVVRAIVTDVIGQENAARAQPTRWTPKAPKTADVPSVVEGNTGVDDVSPGAGQASV